MTFCVASESKQIDHIEVQRFKLVSIDKEDYYISQQNEVSYVGTPLSLTTNM